MAETTRILLIYDLKTIGMSTESIRRTLTTLILPIQFGEYQLSHIEKNIFFTLAGKRTGLVAFLKSDPILLPTDVLSRVFEYQDPWNNKFVFLPFSDYVKRTMQVIGRKIEVEDGDFSLLRNPKLGEIVRMIEDESYEHVEITKSNGKLIKVVGMKRKSGSITSNQLLAQIGEFDFQKIELTVKGGQVIALNNKEVVKL